ncbi:hypothetical protein PanWU01x14_191700 [Parasponia andersonii]|uniref:RNase H type-1 domain-containing protein n=1 Tax=Parasponia andersonii TaxID=3476 RepID=A0A2P5C1M3_PARAD|nr:hypothetical protein PanWU01x14_191700 [Parasponia andersonii]
MVRDEYEILIDFHCKKNHTQQEPYVAELMATKEALSWCDEKGRMVQVLESDCYRYSKHKFNSRQDLFIGDIKYFMDKCKVGSCCFVRRELNGVAHTQALCLFDVHGCIA